MLEPVTGMENTLGYRLIEWRDGHAVVELTIGDQHRNRAGVLHGGVMMTMLDTAGGYCGTYCPIPGNTRRAMSLSITTSFTGQATDGKVRAIGRRTRAGKSIFFASMEMVGEDGSLVATGEGVFRLRGDYENQDGLPMPPLARGARARTAADRA
ncbi:MAG: PaaI family thioesterase [Alphaproteobacteria bacterium]|nr:PaaI family thioesterase [Alphaproteobacteria bacterium]